RAIPKSIVYLLLFFLCKHVGSKIPTIRAIVRGRLRGLRQFPGRERRDSEDCRMLSSVSSLLGELRLGKTPLCSPPGPDIKRAQPYSTNPVSRGFTLNIDVERCGKRRATNVDAKN